MGAAGDFAMRGPRLHNLSILLVDDNAFMLRLLQNLCRGLGIIRILQAETGEQAIHLLADKQIDLLITDWHMEPMDGLELVHHVRNSPASQNPYLPIIMLSGHGDREHVCKARDAGVNMFMAKPVSAKAMYERLVWMVNNPLPFIRSGGYFGPDRRHRDLGPPDGIAERRAGRVEEARATA